MKKSVNEESKLSPTTITGCTFHGPNFSWDGQAVEAVNMLAKAILNLTLVLSSQNVKIGPLLSIGHIDDNEPA